jgi:hypothetical protein
MNHIREPMTCPHCGKFNDCHTCVSEPNAVPSDGDCTMCIGCGKWSTFENGDFRLPTMEEWGIIIRSPDCRRAERAWQRMKEQLAVK